MTGAPRSPDSAVGRPAWLWPRAAYVHVPFCAHHCGYCDFAVVAGRDDRIGRYVEGLAAELATLGSPQPITTLFIGGGTPTHLSPRALEQLLAKVRHWLVLAPEGEFSVEANPGTLDADRVAVLASFGVNRVSLGAQSFQAPELSVLERDHSADAIARAVDLVRRRIDHVSLDLIFGVPGQALANWRADLEAALALAPDHLSTYGLTYEKGTRLWKQRRRGLVQPLGEEAERAQYELAMELLARCGFEHYEISSFARPGRRCRHNEVYWANEAYFGFGMGAARYLEGTRELNTRDLETYLHRTLAGEAATFQRETLQREERARETLSLGLRRAEGMDRSRFREQTGFDLDELAGPVLSGFMHTGHLRDNGTAVSLTQEGKCVADAVVAALWRKS